MTCCNTCFDGLRKRPAFGRLVGQGACAVTIRSVPFKVRGLPKGV
jgi:hypothetical protein